MSTVCLILFHWSFMLVQVRRKREIFGVIRRGETLVRILFFLTKIIPTAIFIPYCLGTQVKMKE